MDKFIIITILVTAVLLIIAGGAVVYSSSNSGAQYNENNALKTVRDFVSAENTYKFDGMSDSLSIRLKTAKTADTYEIIAEFTCRNAGYGDRAGMMTATVLTPHEAVITVEKGKVISAILDGQYDMLTQSAIQGPVTMPRLDGSGNVPTTTGSGSDKPQL